jgi:serine/threonine protein kinase
VLTADERAQMDDMIKQFDVERQELMAKNQQLALQVENLEAHAKVTEAQIAAQLQAREKLRFSYLPIIVLERQSDIREQIHNQEGMRGAGGQAAVYKIEHQSVTLMAKIFHNIKDGAWKRELNALSALYHDNIVRVKYVIYETYRDRQMQEPVGYAMEPMACSLQEFARTNPFKDSIMTHLNLLQQIVEALEHTHLYRFAHRDVTLSNILLNDSSTPTVAKLCDFGCAHFMQTNAIMSNAGGTPYFTAPEFTTNNVVNLDPLPMDVYAFGVVIFKLLHPGATRDELSNCWDPNVWAEVCAFHPAYPSICSLGRACTDKLPSKRPSIKDVKESLRTLIAGLQLSMGGSGLLLHDAQQDSAAAASLDTAAAAAVQFTSLSGNDERCSEHCCRIF